MKRLAAVVFLAGCAAAPTAPAAPAPPHATTPTPLPAATPLPPLPRTLVAASNELAEALRAKEPVRSQRIARARGVIESIVGMPADLVGARNLGHEICALAPTLLGVGSRTGMTSTRVGHFLELGGAVVRFDPEMTTVAPSGPRASSDEPDLDSARFVLVRGATNRLVDLETNAVAAEDDSGGIFFRSRSGRWRLVGSGSDALELRAVPRGKVLSRLGSGEPFVDDVAGVAIVAGGSAFGGELPWLAVYDAEEGRLIRRFERVPAFVLGLPRVGVARDGRAVALNAGGQVVWLETNGRRVSRSVTSGSSFEGVPVGPFFTADGKRACAEHLGYPIVLPVAVPHEDQVVCAFTPPALHREALIAAVEPDPPWQILRGRAQTLGNFPHTLGASAGSSDGTRAAVIETTNPRDDDSAQTRLRLVDAKTGSTQRVWPIGAGNPSDVELRFEAGNGVIVLEQPGGEEVRFVIDERAASPASGKDSACAAPSWDPLEQATCRIGLVMGPAALCEGLDRR